MKSKRQERWIEQGYTDEQINNHLSHERFKSGMARDRKRDNNLKNIDLIKQIKLDLLNKTFDDTTITKINETTDGVGFWFHCFKKFNDGSSGAFKYFYHFDDYVKEEFINGVKYY